MKTTTFNDTTIAVNGWEHKEPAPTTAMVKQQRSTMLAMCAWM
jgi:hypothetical protein